MLSEQTKLNFILIRNSLTRIQAEVADRPDVGAEAPFVRMVERMMKACDTVLSTPPAQSLKVTTQDRRRTPVTSPVPVIKRGNNDDLIQIALASI